MPEIPKKKPESDEEAEEKDSWSEDQKGRGYYYDDAHGYEVYVPEDEDDVPSSSSSLSSQIEKAS